MNNSIVNKVSDTLNSSILQQNPNANVEKSERLISLGAGAFLALKGLTNVFSHPWLAMAELGIGSSLLYRGVTGYCAVKEKLESDQMSATPVPASAMPVEAY
ncbi:DUF2892 domain-containing protein [Pedobacter sp. SYSU D00535]|uniref:YgaP family membrane protein n=1 Tax=Pedobacter sp. SYSU D00535 TaxID=2810308 RepID=UPI001A95A70F|nr:DUF2892 domain-containing protein [Pedobacter sp. SYSU D00535]